MANGDLKVLTADPVTGALSLGLPRPPQYVSGIDKLVQIVALELLNNGGRSIANPSKGGGMRALFGSNIDPDDPSELMTDVQITVSRVEQNIKDGQVNTKRPPSELLTQLQILDIIPDESNLEVRVAIAVINEERRVGQATVAMT